MERTNGQGAIHLMRPPGQARNYNSGFLNSRLFTLHTLVTLITAGVISHTVSDINIQ